MGKEDAASPRAEPGPSLVSLISWTLRDLIGAEPRANLCSFTRSGEFGMKLLRWVHREGWEKTSTNSALPGPGEVSCRYLQGAGPIQAVLGP